MSPTKMPARRRPRHTNFSLVTSSMRLHLCAVAEDPEVRLRHVAALLAFTPTVRRIGNRMRIRFDEPARPIAARVAAIAVRFIAEITGASTPVAVAVR